MIKHIVMWKLEDTLSEAQKQEIKETFKLRLEALDHLMDGILKIEVVIDALASSNMDMMLISEFDKQTTLDAYQVHPKHVEVSSYLKGKTALRSCMDYKL